MSLNGTKGSYADYLSKKETKGNWTPYWVRLHGKLLEFYETDTSEKLVGSVEIGAKTKCVVSQRKTHSFPFMVCALQGRHLFKCESSARRHRWMTAIHQAAELLKYGGEESDLRIQDLGNKIVDNVNVEDEEALPPNVMLVTSLPVDCDSPSLPFKLRNRRKDSSDDKFEIQREKTPPKPETIVYPFSRNSEESIPKISDLERKQFSSLNVRTHSLLEDTAPRVRSFPTTPEHGARPTMSPLSLTASYFGKSRSLNSLTSSPSQNDMRFSRHMINGGDSGDFEV